MKGSVACDDGVAAYYVDGELVKFVSSRESASAYEEVLIMERFLKKKLVQSI